MRINQFGALLVSNTNDYKNNRVGHGTAALVINSPFFYGGLPAHINMSVLEVSFKHRNYSPSPIIHLAFSPFSTPPEKKLRNLCFSFLLGIVEKLKTYLCIFFGGGGGRRRMVSHDFVTNDSLCCDSVFYSRLKIVYRCLVFYIKHCVSVHCHTKTVDRIIWIWHVSTLKVTDVRSGYNDSPRLHFLHTYCSVKFI